MEEYLQLLMEFYKQALFEAKLHLIKSNMDEVQSNHINWYIVIFIILSLALKITNTMRKPSSCSDGSSYSLANLFFKMSVLRIDKRIHEIIECIFSEYTGNFFVTILSICDLLVIIAVLTRKNLQLTYPWLTVVAIILVAEMLFTLLDLIRGCRPTMVQLLVLMHVSYSWCYIYMWGNMVHCPYRN